MKYIVYNKKGEILRQVQCPPAMSRLQAKEGEFVMEGIADDATQKVEFDGLDIDGQPVNPRIVNKTPEEIVSKKPPEPGPIPHGKQNANITNEQWQDVLGKLTALGKV